MTLAAQLTSTWGESGDIELLRWLHARKLFINSSTTNGAASSGNLDVVRFLHSLGDDSTNIDDSAVYSAASNGHVHVLEFLMQQSEWDLSDAFEDAYEAAASTAVGHFHVVQYLHERSQVHGEPNRRGCAANGHLDIVRFLLENRIGRCSRAALTKAAQNGHLEVVQFLCANAGRSARMRLSRTSWRAAAWTSSKFCVRVRSTTWWGLQCRLQSSSARSTFSSFCTRSLRQCVRAEGFIIP